MDKLEIYAEYGVIYKYTNHIYFLLRENILDKGRYNSDCICYLVKGFDILDWRIDGLLSGYIRREDILDL